MAAPEAPDRRPLGVLLDAGGVFLLPEHGRILGAFERAGAARTADELDRAHYAAASGFHTGLDVEDDWAGSWGEYLTAYALACEVAELEQDEVHRHLGREFADAAVWLRVAEGSREGLRALADTGVRLGVVSNADGLIAQRLRALEILQVGPGPGVEVECVIDSGDVGVMKPDPRIFRIALEAMDLAPEDVWYVGDMPAIDVVGARRAGLRPFMMDPFEHHRDESYDTIRSLTNLADRIRALPAARSDSPAPADGGHTGGPPVFTLESAFQAAEEDRIAYWVGDFLASRGSDNGALAVGIADRPHEWLGPVRLPTDRLERLAGPESDVICAIEPEEWEGDVDDMGASIEEGWQPPPVLVEYRDGHLLLQDGNHRYEAMRRSGSSHVWAVVWTDDRADRDRLAAELAQ
ncbi:MAG: hypothetical protein JWL73_811 [Actinomycetia bacterium]|nr:hypothetical protein [Actinomycetes bacterium]